ncbi:hypothetical protein AB0I51_41400 [Streptomyces sp. NPDC050549]|uniref:hypothetical protein n=1 Tax=Streptomyces sp. NPDC050549 TaxID=3155406 RepID=UPI003423FF30
MHDPLRAPHSGAAGLLPVGAALILLTCCYTRRRMFGATSATRFHRGPVLLAAVVVAPLVPALAVLALTTLLLLLVNGVEHWLISTGRSVPLALRSRSFGAT